MNERLENILHAVIIGIGATLLMDAWALLLIQFGIKSLNFAYIGRWLGHILRGQWFHENIATAPPINGELWIGYAVHYSIGIMFAALLILFFGLKWVRSPSLYPAFLIGITTVLAPLFVLQPALGYGIASSKTATPVFNALKSLATHTVYGLGLYLAATARAFFVPDGRSKTARPNGF